MQSEGAGYEVGRREEILQFKEGISFPPPCDLDKLELDCTLLPGARTYSHNQSKPGHQCQPNCPGGQYSLGI